MKNRAEDPLVEIRNLKNYFKIKNKGMLHAVDDVSLEIYPGETLGLVGESGCGKSTIGNLVMRLLEPTEGQVLYRGKDIFSMKGEEKQALCKNMQIIFQDPYSALNPRKTIFSILEEPYIVQHIGRNTGERRKLVEALCDKISLNKELLKYYPHELDGGMRQVVGIARALSLSADFIVCDEPVSSLDVSVQAKVINMLMDLQKKYGLAYLFISHDLSVVKHISNRIAVMYLGEIVEIADTKRIFENTMHPYSIALLSAVPKVKPTENVERITLKGDVPSPINPGKECRFAKRCWMARECCFKNKPPLDEVEEGHKVACFFAKESRRLAKQAERISMNVITGGKE